MVSSCIPLHAVPRSLKDEDRGYLVIMIENALIGDGVSEHYADTMYTFVPDVIFSFTFSVL